MAWKNHEKDPMEQMRRAFLSEIKDLKSKIDRLENANSLIKIQIQEEVKEKHFLHKRIKDISSQK